MIPLTKEMIDNAFKFKKHQADVLLDLYKIAFPDFYDIEQINGWPNINTETWKYISSKFQEFDKEHHPNVIQGGLWMSSGFSGDSEKSIVEEWQIDTSTCKLTYHEAKQTA